MTLTLSVLLLAGPVLLAQAPKVSRDDPFAPTTQRLTGPAARPVLVDPLDFRQPIPEPTETLIPKYGDKNVRFTGTLLKWGQDEKKRPFYDLQAVISNVGQASPTPPASGQPGVTPPGSPGRGKPSANAPAEQPKKETVVARVYLKSDDPRLRGQAGHLELTVEGKGQIQLGTWQLVITDATILSSKPTSPPRR
jgi:hypothetical protein